MGECKMAIMEKIKYVTKGKEIILRNVEATDAEEIIEILNKIDSETTFLTREPGEFNLTLEEERKFLQSQVVSEVNIMILAEVEGKIVGMCAINGNTKRRLRHSASLGITILKDYWGMGIGRKLMETGISWAKNNGISRMELKADTNNHRALALYLKLGFQVEGTLRNDKLLSDGTYRSTYTMALFLE